MEKIWDVNNNTQLTGLITHEESMGIIKFKLFDDIVPETARIFRGLAEGKDGYGYDGTDFHRVVPNCVIQGGIIYVDDAEGSVIYERTFLGELY